MSLVFNGNIVASDMVKTKAAVNLVAASWVQNQTTQRYEYSLASSYPAATYDIEVDLDWDDATDEQIAAWQAAQPAGSYDSNKIICLGEKPEVAIPVIVYALKGGAA